MNTSLRVPEKGSLDFLALGALIHRLDPKIVPFRKTSSYTIHINDNEFNTTANLSNCFGLRTNITTAIIDLADDRLTIIILQQTTEPVHRRTGFSSKPEHLS